ncbi:MAG TPA: hypothetical protein VJI52_06610 [Candidatus Nanoarchaeia archaeon]|nr:hypothetical protein [Candidatus Nanoarchaeia archaeon]
MKVQEHPDIFCPQIKIADYRKIPPAPEAVLALWKVNIANKLNISCISQ